LQRQIGIKMQEYRYIYKNLENGTKEIVVSISQLSGLSGISSRIISENFKVSDVYYQKHGKFKLEKVLYSRDKSKVREGNNFRR